MANLETFPHAESLVFVDNEPGPIFRRINVAAIVDDRELAPRYRVIIECEGRQMAMSYRQAQQLQASLRVAIERAASVCPSWITDEEADMPQPG